MVDNQYADQVRLLVQVLPYVANERIFALKGGTAINLFYRDLPRLSVDIDLTYLPIKERQESLEEINEALDRISESIENSPTTINSRRIAGGSGAATRVQAQQGAASVKIETSPVTRGVVHEANLMSVSEAVEDQFGFAEISVVAFEDLFAGKIVAALDRQHPRDLYDVKLLYENEGLDTSLYNTVLVYIACSRRPPHELLNPNKIDLEQSFKNEFEGMTSEPVTLQELQEARCKLIQDVRSRMDNNTRQFLLGLHQTEPDFNLIGLPAAAQLPAVRWKLINLAKLKEQNPEKYLSQEGEIQRLFGSL